MEKLYHGAAFYPELWDEEIILEDIEKMREVGINIVRIGEFWWSRLESKDGEIDLSFVKKILDLLHKNSIEVIMCTPTPTPPIWLTYNREEILHVNSKGEKMIHGSRQHVCTNNSYFRKKCNIIVERIAKEVGKHPSITLWQLDNEFKCHITECYCPTCKNLWQKWLKKRYGTIENLNRSWETRIWSEEYQNFEQIPQPSENTPFIHHASLSTMYRIFHREKIAEFAHEQADIIKKYSTAEITTNTGLGFALDNELLFKKLDCVGYDTYASNKNFHDFILNSDIWRGIKPNKKFWLLETSVSHTGALDRHAEVHPRGYLEAEAVSVYAYGGTGFLYWLWRQQRIGCELNHSAVISSWGEPSVGYEDVLKVEESRKKIEDFILKTHLSRGEVAITYSDRGKVFMEVESHKNNNYRNLVTDLQKNVLKAGIHRDWIMEGTSLENYKILITPYIYHISKEYLERAEKFVREGGIWIVGPISGGRTEEHTINTDAALGEKLENLAGVKTLYTYPIENSGALGEAFGELAPLKLWSSVFESRGAEIVGTLKGGVTPEKAFITENKIGKGKVVMLGSLPVGNSGDRLIQKMLKNYCEELQLEHRIDADEGIISIPRYDNENRYQVLINMRNESGKINLKSEMIDILSGEKMKAGNLELRQFEYKILKIGG
ncbi:MAG: beta-galactosidase [Cetobacterium sp.]